MKKKFIFMGDFANQMTIYSTCKYLELKGIEVEAYFPDEEDRISKVFQKININEKKSKEFMKYKKFQFLKIILNQFQFIYSGLAPRNKSIEEYYFDKKIIYYEGVHYNLELIQKERNKIFECFEFPELKDEKNKKIAKLIEKTNSVSIHIRRGDYLNHPIFGNICTLEYYKKAIEEIKQRVEEPVFYIFSNDIEWCKNNFGFLENSYYINWNCKKEDNYKDMQLMSLCKNNILANSSFSWWSALLNKNKEKIVIVPEKWINEHRNQKLLWINKIRYKIFGERRNAYENMIPEKWIKIKNY
ncbi:alpha-1,2-fucosyltransferase [Fusobacterium sp.]|uniref:alpha-1,2-fucosyltransferase n=1 Tax=Fusobacterium sp. TaxID=68766 RepID=UPI0025BF587E|nr:alpha-1,2-fucosyltransferase [Fusobacterium sp.]